MREEFDKALLESKKSTRSDEMQTELIKNCEEDTKKIIYQLIQKSYATRQVPRDFTKYQFQRKDCKNM